MVVRPRLLSHFCPLASLSSGVAAPIDPRAVFCPDVLVLCLCPRRSRASHVELCRWCRCWQDHAAVLDALPRVVTCSNLVRCLGRRLPAAYNLRSTPQPRRVNCAMRNTRRMAYVRCIGRRVACPCVSASASCITASCCLHNSRLVHVLSDVSLGPVLVRLERSHFVS